MTDRDLFIAVLNLDDPAERQAYLEEACGDDLAARQRVEALFKVYENAGSFLESPPPSPTSSMAPGSSTELSGTVIGRYKLLQVIGEGGMGTVFMAEQTQPVRRTVALKLIKAGMDSRQVLARFGAERQALALMDHPNIAKVFDAGTTDNGCPYFVMELVKGIAVTRFCDERRLTTRERLELAIPVCQAVQHAHQKGIIHRDLKPSNVLIALYDGKPVPKVIDFGVAKATGPRLTDQTLYTEFGAVVGTLEYMSPEQAELNQLDIDTRSDIYSLGVLLYELLTGSTPLDRRRLKQGAILEMLRVIREEESPRPSLRLSTTEELPSIAACRSIEPRKLSGLVRGELDWIVMKALEKDRNRRYETANGLAADLRRYLDDEPVQACPPSTRYRLGKFARRNKVALSAAGLIAVAMLTGVGMLAISNVLITREKDQKAVALLQARNSAKEANDQRGIAVANEKIAIERAENLAWEDYINRVNRAYREVQDDNIERAADLLLGCLPERRGWEWHYVNRLCHLDRFTLETGASVYSVAYSPDGTWLASGTGNPIYTSGAEEMQIQLWDLAAGRVKQTLRGLKGAVRSLAISPDGTRIAVGSESDVPRSEARLTVWDAATGQLLWSRSEPRFAAVMSVAFRPGGKELAVGYGKYSGTSAGQVTLFEVATGRETITFPGPTGGVNKVAFHPDGKRLAVAGSERVEIWDIDARAKVRDLRGHSRWVFSVAFSPDGKWLATGGWDRTIRLWDADRGAEQPTLFGEHEGFVCDLAFSPDSRLLVSTSDDRSAKLWEAPTGRHLATFHGHTGGVLCVAFRLDGQEIATGGIDGAVKIWNLRTSRPVVFGEHNDNVHRLAFRRDGRRVLSQEGYNQVPGVGMKGWDPVTGDLDPALAGVDFDADRHEFEPGVGIWQGSSSPDRKLVAHLVKKVEDTWGNTVEIRDAVSGRVIHTLMGHPVTVACAAFSPDGRRLATASMDRTIKLWDVATGREVFTLLGHTAGLLCLAISPDGLRIASGGLDYTVRIWDATPLPDEVLKAQEARYQNKLKALRKLYTATDDARRAEIFDKNGQWDLAAAGYSRAFDLHPTDLSYLLKRGLAYGRLGQWDKAEADVSKAVELNAKSPLTEFGRCTEQGHTCRGLGWEFWRTGHLRETEKAFRIALQSFETAATQTPGVAGSWHFQSNTLLQLGRVLRSDGRPREAEDAFRRALVVCEKMEAEGLTNGLSPGEVVGHYQDLVELRYAAGRRQDAIAASKTLLELAPKDAKVHNNLAWWLATCQEPKLRDPARAVELARKAVELAPKQGMFWNTLGVAQYRAGDSKSAIEALTRSMELSNGGDGNDWFFLAMAHWQLGDKQRARSWYDQAAQWMEKNKPKDEELVRFRAEAASLMAVNEKKD